MRWVDYRESLGIGFSDSHKFGLLLNRIRNRFNLGDRNYNLSPVELFSFCNEIGYSFNLIRDQYSALYYLPQIMGIFDSYSSSLKEFIACFCALINSLDKNNPLKDHLITLIKNNLDVCDLGYEILTDNEQFFIYPKGVQIFDEKLVYDPLAWLSKYPKTSSTYLIALNQYNNQQYARDVADNLRKSLEVFLQEVLGNSKNLDNNISEIGTYLKNNNADDELRNMLVFFIRSFKTENDKIAKHHDNVDPKFLEFLLYQTGIFIRMIITVGNNN